MKTLNFILAALFVIFAGLQLNDPDPLLWILLYLYVAAICLLDGFQKRIHFLTGAGIAACIVWMAFLLPEFVSWIRMGMPDIAGQMKAEEPHIEFAREFLGLGICLGVLVWKFFKKKNDQ